MKTIQIDALDRKSIRAAIKEVERYRKELRAKCELFVKRLSDVGINVAMMTLATEGIGDMPRGADFGFHIEQATGSVTGILTATGEGLLYWEFGAGNYYNAGASNPYAAKLGMGVGTYPGQTHVPTPGYWYYTDKSSGQHSQLSYGTQATMPMYKATMEMISQIREIASEVWSNG